MRFPHKKVGRDHVGTFLLWYSDVELLILFFLLGCFVFLEKFFLNVAGNEFVGCELH